MKKFTSFKYWYSLMLMLVAVSFTACVDDNDDTEAPFLEVAPTTLTFTEAGTPAEGSQSYFEIKTNRSWTATVQGDAEWITLSKKAGEGNAKVEVSVPGGIAAEANIDVVVGNKAGELMKETVKVICGKLVPATVIYKETFGSVDVTDKPLVGTYQDWDKSGDGAANVTYSGNNTSIRNSGLANTDSYEGASGPNVVFFGSAPATFVVNKIALQPEQTSLKLTFGASYSFKPDGGDYVNTFDPSQFKVFLSGDGQKWVPIAYDKNNGDASHPYWVLCTANFTLKNAVSELYIKFEASASSANRLDDVTLCTGNGGQEIDLENGTIEPEPEPTDAIFYESVGDADASAKPFVDDYTGWIKQGAGATNISYTATGKVSIRNSGLSNAGAYENASGPNVVFFGTGPTAFMINKIALQPNQTKLQLTFGASYSLKEGTQYVNTFDPAKFKVSLSGDGQSWVPVTYNKNEGDASHPYWVLCTADFTLKNVSSELYIKFESLVSSAHRLDDIKLAAGNGGQEVDLNAGGTEPEPGEAKEITFQELTEKMSAPGIIDTEFDRTLVAVVQNNMTTGTRSYNNLQLAAVNANAAGQGITLYGNIIETAITELSLEQGDKVKVTFIKNMAETKVYNGLNQVTGGKDEVWAKIEKLNEKSTITPVEITVDQLKDYQSMTVLIKNAATQEAGVWCTAENMKSTVLSVNGQDLTVFCAKGSAFADVSYVATTGDIVGIASVHSNNVQLVPRSLEDVKAFASTTVAITGVNPAKLSFPAEGGEQKITVTLANYTNEAITATGLSEGKFTVSVSGTEVTVKANPNEGAAINETLTIAVAGGNSVTVPVAVAAAGGQGGDEGTYTLIEKVANLQPGKYYMAGYRVNYENQGNVTDFSSHPYHIWNGTIKSSKDCDTDQYAFESGKLTAKDASKSLIEVELVAASGENAYYIKVGDKYLYSNTVSKPASRKLNLTDDATNAVWTFVDFEAGAMLPSNNGCSMITAGAQSALIRSYATDSSTVTGASYGIAFFKKN